MLKTEEDAFPLTHISYPFIPLLPLHIYTHKIKSNILQDVGIAESHKVGNHRYRMIFRSCNEMQTLAQAFGCLKMM